MMTGITDRAGRFSSRFVLVFGWSLAAAPSPEALRLWHFSRPDLPGTPAAHGNLYLLESSAAEIPGVEVAPDIRFLESWPFTSQEKAVLLQFLLDCYHLAAGAGNSPDRLLQHNLAALFHALSEPDGHIDFLGWLSPNRLLARAWVTTVAPDSTVVCLAGEGSFAISPVERISEERIDLPTGSFGIFLSLEISQESFAALHGPTFFLLAPDRLVSMVCPDLSPPIEELPRSSTCPSKTPAPGAGSPINPPAPPISTSFTISISHSPPSRKTPPAVFLSPSTTSCPWARNRLSFPAGYEIPPAISIASPFSPATESPQSSPAHLSATLAPISFPPKVLAPAYSLSSTSRHPLVGTHTSRSKPASATARSFASRQEAPQAIPAPLSSAFSLRSPRPLTWTLSFSANTSAPPYAS